MKIATGQTVRTDVCKTVVADKISRKITIALSTTSKGIMQMLHLRSQRDISLERVISSGRVCTG